MVIKTKIKSSVPTGKDELRQVRVVRERWAEYQTKEKRFSKEFADALIDLHKHLAKPGHGTFGESLKELKIPRMTAYRLMQLHGWKAEKRKAEKKPIPNEESATLARSKAVTAAIGFLSRFTGDELRKCFNEFCEELRREVFAEESKESEAT
jgi:hypothetical protein